MLKCFLKYIGRLVMLDELRARFTLSDYIGRKHRVIKRNNRWLALCPFHPEKSPSFYIDNHKGVYHCFGCSRSGDILQYVMESEKVSFKEALRLLADEAGIQLPSDQAMQEREAEFEPLKRACHEAALWYQSQLNEIHKSYLAKRGVTVASQALFQIGFAPGQGLLKHLQNKGVGLQDAKQAGLVVEMDGRQIERFRQRLMFPIANKRGEIIAFGGRLLTDGEPKYLNSPETPLFKKSHVLYGLSHAKPTTNQPYTVVEGYLDVIAMHQAGITAAVAPLGTAVTEHHLQLMWQRCEQPIICMDGDAAGKKAAERVAELALPFVSPSRRLAFANLPDNHDPASFLQSNDDQAIHTYIKQAQPLHEKLWEKFNIHTITSSSTPEEKGRFQDSMKETCQTITHEELRQLYLSEFRQRFFQHIRQLNQPGGKRLLPTLKPQPVGKQDDNAEKLLLALLIHDPTLLESVREHALAIPFAWNPQWIQDITEWWESKNEAPIMEWLQERGWQVDELLKETENLLPKQKEFWRDFWLDVWHNTLYKRQIRQEMGVSLDAFKESPSASRWNKLVAMKHNEERSRT